jgi:hypothetical protein
METSLRHYEPLVPDALKHVNFDKLRVKKVNKTHHAFLGELEVFQSFGDEYKISGLMYKMAGNDYKMLPYKLGPYGWCEFILKYKDVYAEFQAVSDFPAPKEVLRLNLNHLIFLFISFHLFLLVSMGKRSLPSLWFLRWTSRRSTLSRTRRLQVSTFGSFKRRTR